MKKDEYERLVENPIPYDEFKEKYSFTTVPLKHQYDLLVLVHLFRKELREIEEKLSSRT